MLFSQMIKYLIVMIDLCLFLWIFYFCLEKKTMDAFIYSVNWTSAFIMFSAEELILFITLSIRYCFSIWINIQGHTFSDSCGYLCVWASSSVLLPNLLFSLIFITYTHLCIFSPLISVRTRQGGGVHQVWKLADSGVPLNYFFLLFLL